MQNINLLDTVITLKGKIFWSDGRRRINLKKPIREIFEPLETSDKRIVYIMELCFSKEKLIQRAEELLEQETVPVLFYFTKESAEVA